MTRDVVRAALIVLLAVVLGTGLLYASRAQGPGDTSAPVFGVAGVLWLLPIVLLVALVLLAARTMARSGATDRYQALTRIADLRDRSVLSEDEFEREKRQILG